MGDELLERDRDLRVTGGAPRRWARAAAWLSQARWARWAWASVIAVLAAGDVGPPLPHDRGQAQGAARPAWAWWWWTATRAVLAAVARVLSPDVCAACDRPARPGASLCDLCAASVVLDHGDGGPSARATAGSDDTPAPAGPCGRASHGAAAGSDDTPAPAGPHGRASHGAAAASDDTLAPAGPHGRASHGAAAASDDTPAPRGSAGTGAATERRDTAAPVDSRGGAGSLEVAAYAAYGGAVARAVRRLKYEERPDLARPLGQLLRAVARGREADVVVPVPLHPQRLRERGYNQAALLAAAVARELSAPMAARALSRRHETAAQARLDRAGRLHNLDGAFRVRQPERVRGRRVVLVDDVCTTGATLRACEAALRSAGAASVVAVVLARAVRGTGRRAQGASHLG